MSERDYCSVSDYGCANPAGFRSGLGTADNDDPPRCSVACSWCGNVVCAKCRVSRMDRGQRVAVCTFCVERFDRDRVKRAVGDPRPCGGVNGNVCVAEGCYGEACRRSAS